jgi:hypothetical protein
MLVVATVGNTTCIELALFCVSHPKVAKASRHVLWQTDWGTFLQKELTV